MLAILLPLLKGLWAPIAIAALLGLGWLGYDAEEARVEHAKVAQTKAEGDLRLSTLTVADLKGQIVHQNEAIAMWMKAAADLKAQRDHLLEKAETAGATVVTQFVTKYKPVPIGATCALAVAAGAVNAAQVGQLYKAQ